MNHIDFLNTFKLLMWFLGTGAFVYAGVPTAKKFITQFKINIFCKNTGEIPMLFNNLSNYTTRQNLENYFLDNKIIPQKGDND